jgi:hypothetical protein
MTSFLICVALMLFGVLLTCLALWVLLKCMEVD